MIEWHTVINIYFTFQKPERDEWGSGLEAMQIALSLEKNVNKALLDLHKLGDNHGDSQVSAAVSASFDIYYNPFSKFDPLSLAKVLCM